MASPVSTLAGPAGLSHMLIASGLDRSGPLDLCPGSWLGAWAGCFIED
jgi:hypothetical protein